MVEKILPDALDILKEALEDYDFLFVTIAITLAILFKLQTIYNFFQSISKQKLQSLEEHINKDYLTPETRHVLQEQINSIIFKKATGIRAEKYMQEKIVALHRYAKGELKYRDFEQAKNFLNMDCNGHLDTRKIILFEWLTYYLNFVIAIFFVFLAVVIFSLPVYIPLVFKQQILSILLAGLFMYLALQMKAQTFSISAVKKIKKVIENYKQELANRNNIINNQYCLPSHSENSKYQK